MVTILGVLALAALLWTGVHFVSARQRARDREEWLSTTLAGLADAVIITDVQVRIASMNPAAEQATGWQANEARWRPLLEVLVLHAPAAPDPLDSPFADVFRTGSIVPIPAMAFLRSKQGEDKAIEGSAAPIRNPRGQVIGAVIVFRDVTERQIAARRRDAQYAVTQLLAEASSLEEVAPALLRTICESLDWEVGAFWSVEESAQALRCIELWHAAEAKVAAFTALSKASAFTRGVGLPGRVWATGKPVWIPDVMQDESSPRGQAAAGDGLRTACAFPIRVGSDLLGVIELFSQGTRPPDHELLRMMADIGMKIGQSLARQDAIDALRQSESGLRAILDSALDAVISMDTRGHITDWNPRAEVIFGWSRTEVLGRPLGDTIIPPRYREAHQRGLRHFLTTGQHAILNQRIEITALRRDGTEIPVELTVSPLKDGNTYRFTAFIADISRRKDLEAQLCQSQKMDAIGKMAGGIAHDFNNFLTVIKGYSQIALDHLLPDHPVRSEIAGIQQAGESAAALTHQLLAFSRKQVLAPRVLDLNALVGSVESMLTRLISEDIRLITLLQPGLGRVRADVAQLQQVIINLALNARDAMPQGGWLIIETADVFVERSGGRVPAGLQPGPWVRLSVRDTGCGMDAATLARIFEPFFTTKAPGKGTGLGLSTVYGVIKQSSGEISVSSEPGLGTTVTIDLPRAEEPVVITSSEPHLVPPARGTETVLLVEDGELVRTLGRRALQALGYTVLVASNGSEALRAAQAHAGSIHLLVTDVVMPGISGRELAESLKLLRPEMRVLYMSGYTDDAILRHGVSQSVTAFLQKPFGPADLGRKVRDVLDAGSDPPSLSD
jgi:PAS domain S-box-containing protein